MRQVQMRISRMLAIVMLSAVFGLGNAQSAEQPAGQEVERNGLKIMAVYLQPVEMEPAMPDQDPTKSDIHLEADIHALRDNKNGFPADAWVPYLNVSYTLAKKGSAWKRQGTLHPMVASDGPHYGANIALDGPGAYELVFRIAPPSAQGFLHHTDRETGVGTWWAPFEYRGAFNFVGTGKKGKY